MYKREETSTDPTSVDPGGVLRREEVFGELSSIAQQTLYNQLEQLSPPWVHTLFPPVHHSESITILAHARRKPSAQECNEFLASLKKVFHSDVSLTTKICTPKEEVYDVVEHKLGDKLDYVLFEHERQDPVFIILRDDAHFEDIHTVREELHQELGRRVALVYPEEARTEIEEAISQGDFRGALRATSHLIKCRARQARIEQSTNGERFGKIRPGDVKRQVAHSAPLGVDVRSTSLLRVPLPSGRNLHVVDIRAHIPDTAESKIEPWKEELSERLRAFIIIEPVSVYEGTTRQLTDLTDDDGILRDVDALRRQARKISGRFPPSSPERARPLPSDLIDLRDIPFLSFDYETTRDVDDVVYATSHDSKARSLTETLRILEEEPIRVITGFANAAWRVPPDSDHAEQARRLGNTLYANENSLYLLGEKLSCYELSLLPEKDRAAFVLDRVILPDGTIRSSHLVRAKIRNRASIPMSQFASLLADRTHPHHVDALFLNEAKHRLLKSPEHTRTIYEGVPATSGHRMIEALMIASKSHFADVMNALHLPMLYRIHAPFNQATVESFLTRISHAGIDVDADDFHDPHRLPFLIERLQQSGQGDLCRELLDTAIRGRARVATLNRGHFALGVDTYAEIKSLRTYVGLYHQWLLDRALKFHPDGIHSTPSDVISNSFPTKLVDNFFHDHPHFTKENAQKERRHINRKERVHQLLTERLAMFHRIAHILDNQGEFMEVTVTDTNSSVATLSVPEAGHRGIISLHAFEDSPPVVGDSLRVKLDGFLPEIQRFLFTYQ